MVNKEREEERQRYGEHFGIQSRKGLPIVIMRPEAARFDEKV